MARRPAPSVNASLIHEARMIIQQFLGNRQNAQAISGLVRPRKASTCNHQKLLCVFCVDKPSEAVYVFNGYSVCLRHEAKARNPITSN
jgi:hypothetical protein